MTNSVVTKALSNVDNSVQYLRSVGSVKRRVRTGWHAQAAVEFDPSRVFPSAHPDNGCSVSAGAVLSLLTIF